MKNLGKLFFLIIFSVLLFCSQTRASLATQNLTSAIDNMTKTGDSAGYMTEDANVITIISAVVSTVISLLGVVFIGLMIYGGFIWMTARGNEERVTKAKDLMTAAVIGLIIVMMAYAISYFIINSITENTLKSSTPQS
jgi:hypothetical protein